jgi:hypothetical protein
LKSLLEIRMRRLTLALLAGIVLILAAACAGSKEAGVPPSAQALSDPATRYPASGGSTLVEPEKGAIIALANGAEVDIPPGALSEANVVSLREANAAPNVPSPRTILGPAYDFSLEGGTLDGVALLTLPLPQGITPQEYETGAYRWNGRTWEHVGGRLSGDALQIATQNPGLFALQGTWRLGSASLALSLPSGGLQPGMNSVPFTVTGQYRFFALPTLQRGYIPVRLMLKRDTSGGAGQVTGDISLDETVADTSLWFQPTADQARGEIEFQHTFEIQPGEMEVTPGSTDRYYAALQVDDSQAPTTQLSTGVDYTHMLPIRIAGRDVVRPDVSPAQEQGLRWHIRLNGQTWQQSPSADATLPLDPMLATGGIGDYTITLEAQTGDQWITASNEVTVKLAPPQTETPIWTATPEATGEAGEQPGIMTPTPGGPPPATPTRRPRPEPPTPEGTLAVSPTATTSVTPVATRTRTADEQVFWADSYLVAPGECTVLHWNVQNVTEVYLDGQGVNGVESRRVCPPRTTTYVLRSVAPSDSQERRVTISVGTTGGLIDFTADAYQITLSTCTTLRWRAQGVQAVYLNDQGVAGEDTKEVCPTTTATYTLRVVATDGTSSSRSLTIGVSPTAGAPIRFWSDQYTMNSGACTNLHWAVEGVEAVYVGETGSEEGVPGVGAQRVCPDGRVSYTIRVTTTGGSTVSRELVLYGGEPSSMSTDEVIAQGRVRDVAWASDVSPTTADEQPGWNIVVDGLSVLFSGPGSCCADVMTLGVPQALVDQQGVFGVPIDWPINAGQLVEFRAICSGSSCRLDAGPPMYLRLRSQ